MLAPGLGGEGWQVGMTNLESILKSRVIALLTKVHLVKAMVFPVVTYGFESWTIKKAEHWSIHAFELWCWRRLLRVPWPSKRSNQSILKEVSPEYSFERLAEAEAPGLWLLYVKNWLTGKDPDAGKHWRQEEKGTTEKNMAGWHHWLDGHEFEQAPGVGDGQGSLACCSPWGYKELDMTEWLNWRQHIKKQRHYLAHKCPYSQSCGFSNSHVWMWKKTDHWRPQRRLSTEELMLFNCGAGEDSWESLGLRGNLTSQS